MLQVGFSTLWGTGDLNIGLEARLQGSTPELCGMEFNILWPADPSILYEKYKNSFIANDIWLLSRLFQANNKTFYVKEYM